MKSTRRKFVRECFVLTATGAFVPVGIMAAPRTVRRVAVADSSFKVFAALVRTSFRVRDLEGNSQSLELTEARLAEPGLDGISAAPGGERFSLFFSGGAARELAQDTYLFEHVRLGRFPMFIVPVGRWDGSCCYYEAVFNRLLPEAVLHVR